MTRPGLGQALKGLTSRVDGAPAPCKQAPPLEAASPGGPGGTGGSGIRAGTVGERPGDGETGLDVDREGGEGGVEDRSGPGDGLRGGLGGSGMVAGAVPGDGEPPGDDEASRRLRANRALLALAELFWAAPPAGWGAPRSGPGRPSWEDLWGPSDGLSPSTPSLFCSTPPSEGLSHAPTHKNLNMCLADRFCRSSVLKSPPRTTAHAAPDPPPNLLC